MSACSIGERISPRGLAAQFWADALIVLAVVWSTGGLLSAYSPLMLLPVLAASVLGGRAGGLRAAAAVGTGVVAAGGRAVRLAAGSRVAAACRLQQGLLPPVPLAAYTIVANVGGCIATALLVGHLSESLTRTGADLQRATTSLADLTTLSQRVIDSMAGGLIVTDAQGVVVLFNRTAETITGRRADDVLGQPMRSGAAAADGDCGHRPAGPPGMHLHAHRRQRHRTRCDRRAAACRWRCRGPANS